MRWILLTAGCVWILGTLACVPESHICAGCDPADPNIDADFVLTGFEFQGGRFEPAYGGGPT